MKDSDLQVSHISEEQDIVQMAWEINPKIRFTQPENPSVLDGGYFVVASVLTITVLVSVIDATVG